MLFYGIVILLVLLIFLPIITKGGGFKALLPEDALSKRVVCDVVLKNSLFQKVKIESSSCNVIGSCIKPFSFYGSPLSLFSDKGTLRLETLDAKTSQDYKIGELGSKQVQISICTNENFGTLKTISNKGDITDSRPAGW